MAAGSTNSATSDREGGRVCIPERGGGTQGSVKSVEGPMDIQEDMSAGRSEGDATPGRASKHEGGLQGAARFSAHKFRKIGDGECGRQGQT